MDKPLRFILVAKLRPCPKYHVMAYKKGYLKIFDSKRPNRGAPLALGCPPA